MFLMLLMNIKYRSYLLNIVILEKIEINKVDDPTFGSCVIIVLVERNIRKLEVLVVL